MKNLLILGAGATAFFFAALFSGALYWFAPINPCYVSEHDSYGPRGGYYGGAYSNRETYCSGSEINSYQFGLRDVSSRNSDVSFTASSSNNCCRRFLLRSTFSHVVSSVALLNP